MELKSRYLHKTFRRGNSSNRTFMELKFTIEDFKEHRIIGSNRTFMELKSKNFTFSELNGQF